MKRILLVCVATLSMLQGANAQEERKFELGAGGSFGFSLKKGLPNSYGFDLFGGGISSIPILRPVSASIISTTSAGWICPAEIRTFLSKPDNTMLSALFCISDMISFPIRNGRRSSAPNWAMPFSPIRTISRGGSYLAMA